MADKIINTFQQRRQLVQALDDLANTTDEAELTEAARRIVHAFPQDLVISALVKKLDTPSSQLRGGLGHIATLLPSDLASAALHAVLLNRSNSSQLRVTAALILERFLGEELPRALLGDLADNNEVAFQSLREAVEEGVHNRHILLEYATQMRQTDEEIAFIVMDMLKRVPEPSRVELLRLIAQDDRLTVAASALDRLEQLGGGVAREQAAAALHTLAFTLSPALAQQAARSARKLTFGGVRYVAPTPDDWHALISPVDMAGNQSIWFVRRPRSRGVAGALVGLIINDRSGVLRGFGADAMQREDLPAAKSVGQMVTVEIGSGVTATMLEAPLDFARWLVQRSLENHWRQLPGRPVPEEYKLYNNLIWQFEAPKVDDDLRSFYQTPADDRERLDPVDLDQRAQRLLAHPIMSNWNLQNRLVLQSLRPELLARTGMTAPQMVTAIMREMDRWDERDQFMDAIDAGLRGQAAWLQIAGNAATARDAMLLAEHAASQPLSQNPLVARMVAAGIDRFFSASPGIR